MILHWARITFNRSRSQMKYVQALMTLKLLAISFQLLASDKGQRHKSFKKPIVVMGSAREIMQVFSYSVANQASGKYVLVQ